MAPGVQIGLSFMLTFGVPLLIAAHEISALRRGNRGGSGRRRKNPEPKPIPPAPPPARPDVEKKLPPLPDCLIPVMTTRVTRDRAERARILEPV